MTQFSKSSVVWAKIDVLRKDRKAAIAALNENAASELASQMRILSKSLGKNDRRAVNLLILEDQTVDQQQKLLIKIDRYLAKTEIHISHLQDAALGSDQVRKDEHFHRLQSRITHLSAMVKEYDEKFRQE